MRPAYALALGLTTMPLSVAAADEPAAAPTSTTYALTASGSDVYVVIRNDETASLSRLGHNHVIYASKFTGSVTWPSEAGGTCAIDIRVPVAALVVDPPGLRAKAGLDENTIDDSDKASLQKNMWSAGQLDSTHYTEVRFQGTKCSGNSGAVKVDGTLTFRGKPIPLSVNMNVTAAPTSFAASGKFESSHTALGYKPFAASFMGPRNQDRLSFTINVKGSPK